MTPLLEDMMARKRERRKELAALPVGEKLRMLEQILADTHAIVATHLPKPANGLKVKIRPRVALEPPGLGTP
ncbi:MAG TPA: hypothetical protein VGE39_19160 [Prosthecobacter sp.]